MLVGVIEHETSMSPIDLLLKEVNIKGSLAYTKKEFEIAIQMLDGGGVGVEVVISDEISLEDIEEKGFKRLMSSPKDIKILVKP